MLIGGIVHVTGMAFLAFYAFLFQKSSIADTIFVSFICILALSWMLFKNECLISYTIRKMKDPNYVMGSDAVEMDDFKKLFGPIWAKYVADGLLIFMFISFFLVSMRSKLLPVYLIYLFVSCSVIYLLSIRKFFDVDPLYRLWSPVDSAFRLLFTIVIIASLYSLFSKKFRIAQSI